MRNKLMIIYTNEENIKEIQSKLEVDNPNILQKIFFVQFKTIDIIQDNKKISFFVNNVEVDLEEIYATFFINIIGNLFYMVDFFEHFGIKCFPDRQVIRVTSNKMIQQLYFYFNNVPFVKSYYPLNNSELIPDTSVMKPLSGSLGNGVVKMENYVNKSGKAGCFFQDLVYCSSPKSDIRIITNSYDENDYGFMCAEKRICKDEYSDFRTNLSQGNIGEYYIPTDEEKELAYRAIKSIPGMLFGGVDIIKDRNGKYYVLEVNTCPGRRICEISNVDFHVKIIEYLVSLLDNQK